MDPGTALAVVSLSFQVFGGCVKGLMLISKARNFGKEASLLQSMLSIEEYRFIQWARAVNLLKDSDEEDNDSENNDDGTNKVATGKASASTDIGINNKSLEGATSPTSNGGSLSVKVDPRLNTALASEMMVQLQNLLTTDQLRKRYKLELLDQPSSAVCASESASAVVIDKGEATSALLQNLVPDSLRQRILGRAKLIQHENHLPKRLWWAAVDKKRFEGMVLDVRAIVDGLWALLDPLQRADSSALMRDVLAKVIQISKDVGELRAMQQRTTRETGTGTLMSSNNDDNILSIAADIKIARIEMNDPDVAYAATVSGGKSKIAVQEATTVVEIPKVDRNLLTNVASPSSNAHTAYGLYDNNPVWLEYKDVPQRMKGKLVSRVKSLAFLLAKPKHPSFHTLQCIGFLEEEERFVFLYHYPVSSLSSISISLSSSSPSFNSGDGIQKDQQDELPQQQQQPPLLPKSLNELIRENETLKSPSVTHRLSIARQLGNTLLTLHTAGWLHKNLCSENIMFFGSKVNNNNWIEPYITGFSFSRQDSPSEISEQPSSEPQADIYRHPHALGNPSTSFQKHMDLYSLGTILVELAEWKALKHIVKDCVDVRKVVNNTSVKTSIPLSEIAKLPKWLINNECEKGQIRYRMGDTYAEVVHACLKFGLTSKDAAPDTLPDLLDMVRKLESCRI